MTGRLSAENTRSDTADGVDKTGSIFGIFSAVLKRENLFEFLHKLRDTTNALDELNIAGRRTAKSFR